MYWTTAHEAVVVGLTAAGARATVGSGKLPGSDHSHNTASCRHGPTITRPAVLAGV